MARRNNYWKGFAAGAGSTVVTLAIVNFLSGSQRSRVVRIEKSLQIGRPVEEVFAAWSSLEWLKNASPLISDIRIEGRYSRWRLNLARGIEWVAEVEQFIPNQAIGWKSVSGPKHSGRITFAPIGDNTLIQVTMNYMPSVRILSPLAKQFSRPLEHSVERVLRDFKASLEMKGQENRMPVRSQNENAGPGTAMGQSDLQRATGTYGNAVESRDPRFGSGPAFGSPANPVDYTAPPDAKR